MYAPEAFLEEREEVLCAAIARIGLAALVTPAADRIEVSHVPMVLEREDGRLTLSAHVARGNPHWRAAGAGGAASVAVFQGPQAYFTPSWYLSKQEHGKVVPTWAYIAVHAHGPLHAVSDDAWLARHLDTLTAAREAGRAEPWQVADAPEAYIGALSRGIVGLRLTVTRLTGSRKINQHKSEADRTGTAEGLEKAGGDGPALAAALRRDIAGGPRRA